MTENLPDTNVGNIEYISKSDAVGVIEKEMKNYASDIWYKSAIHSALNDVNENIKSLEPANVVPVVHAYWIDTDNYYRRWRCSACSGHTKEAHPPVCPFCGAKMDGDE